MGIERFAIADIGRIFRGQAVTGLSESQLLERYLERQDEVAFEALVARHGPMVLGVCRRLLGSQSDVEDAFQATFLVLVRRARQLGPRDAIGPWLHGVATRVALRARSEASRRRRFESTHIDAAAVALDRPPDDREVAEVVDQELCRLPSKYRSPIVLCYLEGQTHEEAARLLKWPLGTVKGRLARARDLLRGRLARRGLAPSALVVTASLGSEAKALVPHELLLSTVRSGLKYAIGHTTAQVASTSIASLVEGALTAMFLHKIQWIGAALLISALALAGAGVMAQQHGRPPGNKLAQPSARASHEADLLVVAAPKVAAADRSQPVTPAKTASDTRPLASPANTEVALRAFDPQGHFLEAARSAWNKVYSEYEAGSGTVDRLHGVSTLLMEAQQHRAGSPAEAAAAVSDHLDRIRSIARLRQKLPHARATVEGDNAKLLAFAAKAELELAQGGQGGGFGGDGRKPQKLPFIQGAAGRGKDAKSRLIVTKLDNLVAMKFADETPLEDVLKHIKEATRSAEFSHGIPIYVDPIGLQEADKSMTSTVRIDLEGVPLKRTLQLVLKQLGLAYFVEDGMIYITSQESFDQMRHLEPAMPEVSPLLEEGEQALRGELSVEEMKQWLEKYKTCVLVKKALEASEPDEEVAQPRLALPTLDQEMKKLTAANDELKKKLETVEAQLAEIRALMMQLARPEKPATEAKQGGRLR